MILPRVKSQIPQSGVWTPDRFLSFAVAAPDTFGAKAVTAMGYFLPDHILTRSEQACVTMKCIDKAPYDEWYRLTVTENGAVAEYADALGAVHAMATLAQLILDGEIAACVIEDYPEYGYRGLMLDFARGIREPLHDVNDVIVHMALCKYNYLHLHLQDAESLCYRSDAVPKLSGSKKRKGRQYTKDQLRALVKFADIFSIEIIPEIEIPSHARDVLRNYPEFRCAVDPTEHTSIWCICPAQDGVFSLYEKLIREIAEIFPGKYIHIGSDELEFIDAPTLNAYCYWRECPNCKKLREEKGLADIREEFYYVMQRVYDIVKSCGKTMMMWNDQIDIAKECPLPKDIFIQFWRIAGAGRGPVEGCSMEGFARQGFHMINSYFPQTYIDSERYLKDDKLCHWTPVTDPEIYEEGHKYVMGSEMCAWEYGNREIYDFYDYTVQPSLVLFADRLWCSAPVDFDRTYRKDVYKLMFGKTLDRELYPIFGSIIPPKRSKDGTPLSRLPLAEIDRDYVAACIEELAQSGMGGVYAKMRFEYIKLLQRITVEQFRLNEEAAKAAAEAAANVAIANA